MSLFDREKFVNFFKKNLIFKKNHSNKVAIFSTHSFWPYHFETELELILKELNNGNNVTKFVCQNERDFCLFFNENIEIKKSDLCHFCKKRNFHSEDFLITNFKKQFSQVELNLDLCLLPKISKIKITSIDEFKKLKIKNFDVGYAVLSSLISIYENPNIVLQDYEETICKMYQEAVKMYFYTIMQIKKYRFDYIYIFNGRFYDSRAVLRAAEFMNIKYYVHERGSDITKFSLSKNSFPHNKQYFCDQVENIWLRETDIDLKKEISSTFFKNRRIGIIKNWVSFTDSQILNNLELNYYKKTIAFYTSSEDEFMSIDSTYEGGVFSTQLDALDYISNLMSSELKEFQLIVRMHPNSKRMGIEYINTYLSYGKNNIIVIEPENQINSYYILDRSDIVLTYGSTIGIESTYYKKKTIDLSNGIYSKLDGPEKLSYKEQLVEFILSDKLFYSYSMDSVIKVGYYLETYGESFKYFKPKNLFEGEVLGVNYNNL